MFRFLLILGLIVYLIYKVGSLFFRAGAASQQIRDQQRRNFDANTPTKAKGTTKNKSGEYIDYEEVN